MKRQQLILILLACFFLAPGLCAYVIYTHPDWIQFSKTNKGELLKDPTRIVIEQASKKWHLVLWQPASCDQKCLQTLDKLAKIRLSLGRRWYDIDQWLLGSENKTSLSPALESLMKKQAVFAFNLTPEQISKATILNNRSPEIFLVDPDNYWIMRYKTGTRSADIFSDLKKILGKDQ